jgi:hypothetical protein
MKYKEVISTGNFGWEADAEQLAQQRQPFVLVGWRYSFDDEPCTRLAKHHNYRYRFDPNKDRAFFDPLE